MDALTVEKELLRISKRKHLAQKSDVDGESAVIGQDQK